MARYRAEPTRPDKVKAIAAVGTVYAIIIAAVLLMPGDAPMRLPESEPTILVDVVAMPPPQPPPEVDEGRAEEEEGAAGRKAEPSPVVAPSPRVEVPAPSPVTVAPIAGSGSASSAGASTSGTGPGAGGSGSGRGGGGSGGGGGIASQARLLGGNSARLPARLLSVFPADRGFAHLWLTIASNGRVSDCSVLQSSGDGAVDQALCNVMLRRSRWEPARDAEGRPLSVRLRYTATWTKN